MFMLPWNILLLSQDEFQTSIIEDLGKIGVKPDVVTFTSDYFETIRNYAIWYVPFICAHHVNHGNGSLIILTALLG